MPPSRRDPSPLICAAKLVAALRACHNGEDLHTWQASNRNQGQTLSTPPADRAATQEYIENLIRRIVLECPRRTTGSHDERRAQEILRDETLRHGGGAHQHTFRHNTSLNAAVALHFGLAAFAGITRWIHPVIALALHLLVVTSFVCDSRKRCQILHRMLPRRASQNIMVTMPGRKPLRRRVVLLAHADAACTGWMFRPSVVRGAREDRYWTPLRFLRKPFLIAVIGLLLVSWFDFSDATLDAFLPWNHVGYVVWHVYFLVLCLLNLQVVLRGETVPGANDNLSSCSALPVLAQRLAAEKPKDIELVFVFTGCEEPGAGGAWALVKQMRDVWDRNNTVILAIECIGQGEPRIFQEGEILAIKPPQWLMDQLLRVAAGDPRFSGLSIYRLPAGCTDALPFLVRGFPSICLGRVDPQTGVPAHYHVPTDTPEQLDCDLVVETIDFVERFVRSLIARDVPRSRRCRP